jgi:hypothetical protein
MGLNIKGFLFVLILSALTLKAGATHLRAGEITAIRKTCNSRTYIITVTVYIDRESGVQFGGVDEILHFGDGDYVEIPETPTVPRDDLGRDMGMATFVVEHTYSSAGAYLIRYSEPFRNRDVVNINDPLTTKFYVETRILIDPLLGCDNTPRLQVPPIDKACTGSAWFHNPGAFDVDGDSISYELGVPKQELNFVVNNYRSPASQEFYDRVGINYGTANENQNGPPTFEINARTGILKWDAPGVQGEYNIAFFIRQWRKINDTWVEMGYVVRDMQILVEDCLNQRPELIQPADICVEAGELIDMSIFGFDPDSDSVKIEAFSNTFSLSPSPATFVPGPTEGVAVKYQASSPSQHAEKKFIWQTNCAHIKREPYQVNFKITDKPTNGPPLTHFVAVFITVVGPAPQWEDAQTVINTRTAQLTWESYACTNASQMQVWRRVDQFPFVPPECVTGMPDFLGYTLIDTVPIAQTTYTDNNDGKGLASGAQYCYRLVAVFPGINGGESYVSMDTCLAPILADAPVITNVTVDQTDVSEGKVTVRWRPAFEVSEAQFPPPYTFEVYRAEGITGNLRMVKTHAGRLSDTSFVDSGINTDGLIFNYRIVQYDNLDQRLDTSFVASTVRLEAEPQLSKIDIVWTADVPWSIKTDEFPGHVIFRGGADATESEMVPIDTVNVLSRGFRYTDDGSFNGQPLSETDVYCYRVLTLGSYGNPKIDAPLLNYSQIVCARPNDEDPPCVPILDVNLAGVNCEELIRTSGCGANIFSNTLKWNRPEDPACAADIASYTIYITDKIGGEFVPYAENVRDTFFIDANEKLKSFARCYKVKAVDRSGNESELSDEFCFDNCPNYELPNVFTPGDEKCNSLFSAFSERTPTGESGEFDCGQINPDDQRARCARFVESVVFTVYNRWGTEIYNYRSPNKELIHIDWDGRDNAGTPLSAGVYYYIAEVTFDVVDPAQQTKQIKGWVHLIR